jgi:hypothetical protein
MAKVTRRKPSNMSRAPNLVTQRARQRIGRRKTAERCNGGALDGHTLYLMSAGTLPFTLNGMRGYYDSFMKWVEL